MSFTQEKSLEKMCLAKESFLEFAVRFGHEYLFDNWDTLNGTEQSNLLLCTQSLDFAKLNEVFNKSINFKVPSSQSFQPPSNITQRKDMTLEKISYWRSIGFEYINKGKVGVVILAGGQGTRLGSNKPKGCFNVGLPSNKSLFQIHCERILQIQKLARQREMLSGQTMKDSEQIYVYIMTSVQTNDETCEFFKAHQYFGLDPIHVKFFKQGCIPCFTEEGKIIMETNSKIAMAPDGNGGIYSALEISGCLDHMEQHGIECVDCFSVDNLLAKAADPLFLGHCIESNMSCGSRVVCKAYPEEKVGVFVSCKGKHQVVEYSELSPDLANFICPDTHQLKFNWGNICMHFYTTSFLRLAAKDVSLPYHVARKNISSKGDTVQGIKLEKFIFDAFQLADNGIVLMEVHREQEYAPVKNASGCEKDSPDTARNALYGLHKQWIRSAGGTMDDRSKVEISPLVSYEGENLVEICQGEEFLPQARIYLDKRQ